MNIIEAFYMGKLIPAELPFKATNDYKQLLKEYDKLYAEIKAALPPDIKNKLLKLSDCQLSMSSETNKDAFYKGFILGIKITAEAISFKTT